MAAQPKHLHLEHANYLEGGGIYGWLTTVDHKRIAVLYCMASLFFMLLGGIEAMLIRTQLACRTTPSSRPTPTTRCSRCTA